MSKELDEIKQTKEALIRFVLDLNDLVLNFSETLMNRIDEFMPPEKEKKDENNKSNTLIHS